MSSAGRTLGALLRRYVPILDWGRDYSRRTLSGDLIAAAIVSIMLIPQSLAYALLVGVPPQVGLYASMAPLLLYAIFGTSRAAQARSSCASVLCRASKNGQLRKVLSGIRLAQSGS